MAGLGSSNVCKRVIVVVVVVVLMAGVVTRVVSLMLDLLRRIFLFVASGIRIVKQNADRSAIEKLKNNWSYSLFAIDNSFFSSLTCHAPIPFIGRHVFGHQSSHRSLRRFMDSIDSLDSTLVHKNARKRLDYSQQD